MAKNDLLGGALWENYSDKVSDRMNNPKFMGEITEEQAAARGCKTYCCRFRRRLMRRRCSVCTGWWIRKTDIILDSKYKSFGCGTAIASSDVTAELCIGKTVDEAVKITNLDVEKALRDTPDTPAVPPQKMHCSALWLMM